jgi:hypothetical protein
MIFFLFIFFMTIPHEFRINDSRSIKDFTKKTFSNYLIKDVLTVLNKALLTCKLEEACNWSFELLISGQFDKFWDKVFSICYKNININNPKVPCFLLKRYEKFCMYRGKYENSLELRNNQVIRNMFCEICCVICHSVKLKSIGFSKIKDDDFNANYFTTKLKADRDSYISDKVKFGDPSEMKIILNEFNYCLMSKNYELCNYWLSWAFEYEKKKMKKDKVYLCAYRTIENIDKKYCNDICWFIWEILIKESFKLNDSAVDNIQALYKLYKDDYKSSQKSKKNYIFLYAIKYFTDIFSISNSIIPDFNIIIQACSNVNNLFTDKINNSSNVHKTIQEKKNYNTNVITIKQKITEKDNKEKVKKLKEIADMKMKMKINAVEQIDSLILNGKI